MDIRAHKETNVIKKRASPYKHLDYATKKKIIELHENPILTYREIGSICNCSRYTVSRIVNNSDHALSSLPQQKLNASSLTKIEQYIEEKHGQTTANSIKIYISTEIGKNIDNSTIYRALKNKLHYKKKRGSILPININSDSYKILRQQYVHEYISLINQGYTPISVDETGIFIGERLKYTWTKSRNRPKILQQPNMKKINMIAGIAYDGFVFFEAHESNTNQIHFLSFISDLIEYIKHDQRMKDKKYFLLFDNSTLHRSILVKNYISKENIATLLTPPYSPSFAPIELCFNHVKHILRSNNANNE